MKDVTEELGWAEETCNLLAHSGYDIDELAEEEEQYDEFSVIPEAPIESQTEEEGIEGIEGETEEFAEERLEFQRRFNPLEKRGALLRERVFADRLKRMEQLLAELESCQSNNDFAAAAEPFKSLESELTAIEDEDSGARERYSTTLIEVTSLIESLQQKGTTKPEALKECETQLASAQMTLEALDAVTALKILLDAQRIASEEFERIQLAEVLSKRADYSEELRPRRQRCEKIWSEVSKPDRERLKTIFDQMKELYHNDDYGKIAGLFLKLDDLIDEIEYSLESVIKKRKEAAEKIKELSSQLEWLRQRSADSACIDLERLLQQAQEHLENYGFDDVGDCLRDFTRREGPLRRECESALERHASLSRDAREMIEKLRKYSQSDGVQLKEIASLLEQAEQARVDRSPLLASKLAQQAFEATALERDRVELLLEIIRGEFAKQFKLREERVSQLSGSTTTAQRKIIENLLNELSSMAKEDDFEKSTEHFLALDQVLDRCEANHKAKPECLATLSRIDKRWHELQSLGVNEELFIKPLESFKQARLLADESEYAKALQLLDGIELSIDTLGNEEEERLMFESVKGSGCEQLLKEALSKGGIEELKKIKDRVNGDMKLLASAYQLASKSLEGELNSTLEKEYPTKNMPKSKKEQREWNRKKSELLQKLQSENQEKLRTLTLEMGEAQAKCAGMIEPNEFASMCKSLGQSEVLGLLRKLSAATIRECLDTIKMAPLCELAKGCLTPEFLQDVLVITSGPSGLGNLRSAGIDGSDVGELLKSMGAEKCKLMLTAGLRVKSSLRDYWKSLAKQSTTDLSWCLQYAGEPYFRFFIDCLSKGKVSDLQQVFMHVGNQPVAQFDKDVLCKLINSYNCTKVLNVLQLTQDMPRDVNLLSDFLSWGVTEPGGFFDLVRLEADLKGVKTASVVVEKNSKVYKGGSTKKVTAMTGFLNVYFSGTHEFDIHIHWTLESGSPHPITSMHVCPIGGSKGGFECQKMNQFKNAHQAVVQAINNYGVTGGPVQ